jgi:hypothetical protein
VLSTARAAADLRTNSVLYPSALPRASLVKSRVIACRLRRRQNANLLVPRQTPEPVLPFAEDRRRIEPCRATGWHPRGHHAHGCEHGNRAGERHRITCLQLKQQRLYESRRPDTAREAQGQTGRNQYADTLKHKTDDTGRGRTECHAQPDVGLPLAYGMRNDSVEAHGREQQR